MQTHTARHSHLFPKIQKKQSDRTTVEDITFNKTSVSISPQYMVPFLNSVLSQPHTQEEFRTNKLTAVSFNKNRYPFQNASLSPGNRCGHCSLHIRIKDSTYNRQTFQDIYTQQNRNFESTKVRASINMGEQHKQRLQLHCTSNIQK